MPEAIEFLDANTGAGRFERTGERVTLESRVGEGDLTETQAQELIDLYVGLGRLPQGAGPDMVQVSGESREVFDAKRQVFELVNLIHEGADASTVFEEHAESYLKQAVASGHVRWEDVARWRRSLDGGHSASSQGVGEGRGSVALTPDAKQRRDALAAQEPIVIESSLPEDFKEARAQAKRQYAELERTYTNRVSGRQIEMVNSGFDKLRDHSANLRTLKIIPALGQLVENAIPLFENTGSGKHWYHYGAAAVIDGEAFFVRLVAYEGSNNKLQLDIFHDAQVTPREIVEEASSLGRSRVTKSDAQGRSLSRELLVQWWQLVKEQESSQGAAAVEEYSPHEQRELVEWFSERATAYVMGRAEMGAGVPARIRAFLRRLKEAVRRLAQLAAQLMELERAGKLDGDFQMHLARAVGLDEGYAERQQWAQGLAEERAQAEREARGDALSAREVLLDLKLPTPRVERGRGGLGGELENLWTGLRAGERLRLFRKDAPSLDRVAEGLREQGFSWVASEDDVVGLAEAVFLRGEEIFGDDFRSALEGYDLNEEAKRGVSGATASYQLEVLAKAKRTGEPVPVEVAQGGKGLGGTYQLAWHGSPHRGIEKEGFKLAKIGTGEGAQAYGWGIYFAENKAVAESYRRAGAEKVGIEPTLNGRPLLEVYEQVQRQAERGELVNGFEKAEMLERLLLDWEVDALLKWAQESGFKAEVIQWFRAEVVPNYKQAGQLYRVELPENEELLDLGKPFSEQPEGVQAALRHIATKLPESYSEFERRFHGHENYLAYYMGLNGSGEQLYGAITESLAKPLGLGGKARHIQKHASELLLAHGIPGLRYLDGSSRADGEGTYNFVIWDESRLLPEAAQIGTTYQLRASHRATERAYGGRAAYDRAKERGATKLSYGQWLAVRTPEFKQWFGDWEGWRAQKRLDAMEPVAVAVPEAWRGLSKEQWRAKMVDSLSSLMADERKGRPATAIAHPELGEIFVNRDGINKTKSASADPAKILVAANLKEVLPQAIYAHSESLNKPKRDTRLEGYATLYAKVDVDGVELVAVFTVERKTDGKWYYNTVMRLAAAEDEKTRKFQIGGVTGNPVQVSPLAGLAEGKRDTLRRVKPESVSKVVDPETGEPLVFYHGTQGDFSAFSKKMTGSATLAKDAKGAFFFTSSPQVAEDFAGYVYRTRDGKTVVRDPLKGASIMPVFLRLKEPDIWSMGGGSYKEGELAAKIAEAKREGADGVAFTHMADGSVFTVGPWKRSHVVAVFSPEQVKSATGNRGSFDGADPDITHQLRLIDEGRAQQQAKDLRVRAEESLTAAEREGASEEELIEAELELLEAQAAQVEAQAREEQGAAAAVDSPSEGVDNEGEVSGARKTTSLLLDREPRGASDPAGAVSGSVASTSGVKAQRAMAAQTEARTSAPVALRAFAKVGVALGRAEGLFNRSGRGVGKRALGHYEHHSQVTRIRNAGDVEVGAHELAHAIEDALWGIGELGHSVRLPSAATGELDKLGRALYGEKKPTSGYVAEGFAEFIRLELTDSQTAQGQALGH